MGNALYDEPCFWAGGHPSLSIVVASNQLPPFQEVGEFEETALLERTNGRRSMDVRLASKAEAPN